MAVMLSLALLAWRMLNQHAEFDIVRPPDCEWRLAHLGSCDVSCLPPRKGIGEVGHTRPRLDTPGAGLLEETAPVGAAPLEGESP